MAEKNLVCIGCPMGCNLQVEIRQGNVKSIRGNLCRRGEEYARSEVLAPRRFVTSLLPVAGYNEPLSVRSEKPVPKEKIFQILNAIKEVKVELPVKSGDVIIGNILDTGVNIIATRSLPTSQDTCRNAAG